ncbi:TIGR04282 family arsenosugar biosynthesis glycosyltransferase [Bosea sp. (in: a-proteobacteria)]|jgi:rSAM/selenodomain-associated transferase 1|uniref:TIGR04282 family arsenosugar biosynthesis glycosyltransferase n=1 Tax=Bosea sp. (in: a-proteobacteria) TaxID=1871050 RepID=UPI003F6E9B75
MVPTLIVMVKAPLAGRIKTRLAREVGAVEAVRFYRAATAALLRRVGFDRRWRTLLAVDPPRAIGATFWPVGLARCAQGPGDLGARMRDLLALTRGPIVLIGSDIPGIAPGHLNAAFAALRHHDAVFGPAEDGGFWLVGLRAGFRPRHLFDGVRWSSEHALADTLANLADARVALVETLFDVDDARDWRRWKRLPLHGRPA